ncbi:hypothetical protein P4S64_19055 [Vibrio sp. M60_M31a]
MGRRGSPHRAAKTGRKNIWTTCCHQRRFPHEVVITTSLGFKPSLDGEMEPPLWLFGEADN